MTLLQFRSRLEPALQIGGVQFVPLQFVRLMSRHGVNGQEPENRQPARLSPGPADMPMFFGDGNSQRNDGQRKPTFWPGPYLVANVQKTANTSLGMQAIALGLQRITLSRAGTIRLSGAWRINIVIGDSIRRGHWQ